MPKLKIITASLIALSAASYAARADVMTYTQSLGGDAYNTIDFTAPVFNASQGTLTGVTFAFGGKQTIYIGDWSYPSNQPPIPFPYQVGIHNTIVLAGFGSNNPAGVNTLVYALPDSRGTVGTNQIIGTDYFQYTFNLPSSDYAGFSIPNYGGWLGLYSTAYSLTTGAPSNFGATSEGNPFQGSLTTTFTYTPVPEPGSLALLGTALVMLAGATIRKQRKGSL
jgi:hypothetical protein